MLLITWADAVRHKPDIVDEKNVAKLLKRKCIINGLFWTSWVMLIQTFLSLGEYIAPDFYVMAFFVGNFLSVHSLYFRSTLIASGVDWKNNPNHPDSITVNYQKKEKSILKKALEVTSNFHLIFPIITCFIILIGLKSPPPIQIMLYWGMGASLMLAILLTYKKEKKANA